MKSIQWIYLFLILSSQTFPQADFILHIPDNSLSWNPIENIDSLKNLQTHISGIELVNVMCEISYSLNKIKPNGSSQYADRAFNYADSIGYNNGRVMALYILSSKFTSVENDLIKSRKLMQKAEAYLDETVHWTLKYRLWFGIADRFKIKGQLDSAMFYYNKPLVELDGEEYWYAHLGSYNWLVQYAQLNHQYKKELEYLEKIFNLILNHFEYHNFKDEKTLLEVLGKLGTYYTRHGEFNLAVANNHLVLDSLYHWNISPATKKVYIAKYLGKIGRAYHHWGKFDSAIRYHDSSLYYFRKVYNENLTELNNDSYPIMSEWAINYANQLEEKAGVQIKTGDLTFLETNLRQSVQLRKENKDILGVAMSFDKLGELFAAKGMFVEARQFYDSALILKNDFRKNFSNANGVLKSTYWNEIIDESISQTYLKIGQLYDAWEKPNLSISYFIESLVVSRKIDYQKGEAEALTNLGDVCLLMHQPDTALLCYEDAGRIYQSMENRPGMAMVEENMGNYYCSQGKLREALTKYINAEILYEDLDMLADQGRVLLKQANIHLRNNDLQDAIKMYEKGLQIAEKLNLSKLLIEGHKKLSEIYDTLNEIEKAYFHYKAYTVVNNAIFTLEANKQIAEVETQFETEKKEQQFLLLQKENELQVAKSTRSINLLIVLIIVSVVMGLLLIVYFRQNKLKTEQEKTILQQKLLRLQMNPHFIFNSLASIQNSIINDEPMKASKYLARFSKLVRNILDSSVENSIPLKHEIRTIDNYLALQKVRFPDKFDYSLEIDEKTDTENTFIPPMLAQPFIENSIEHCIKHKGSKGNIYVRFKMDEDNLIYEVEDDGVGREKAKEILLAQDMHHKSLATSITLDRIKVLNKKSKHKIKLEIIDLKNDKGEAIGTRVIFIIPNQG